MLQQVEKLIIVVGCQRSGTTLTAQILGAPPNALLLDESDGLYAWFGAYAANKTPAGELLNSMLKRCCAKYSDAPARIVSHGGNRFTIAGNVRYLVLKAPNLTYEFSTIAKLNLPVAVAYPVRDPRSVVASMLKLKHIDFINNQLRLMMANEDIASEFAREVALLADTKLPASTRQAYIWLVKSGLEAHFLERGVSTHGFRYEDLIKHPRKTCLELTGTLGIPFHDDMCAHETVYVGAAQGKTDRTRAIDEASLSNWSAALSSSEEERICCVAGSMMRKFGYL